MSQIKTLLPQSPQTLEGLWLSGLAQQLQGTEEESSQFRAFQEKYRLDPAGFVHDCIRFAEDGGPTRYQDEILEALVAHKRVAARGPHGPGKTAIAAWVTLWAVLTADDCKVPTTASAWRQLTKFLWPEVHKWAWRVKWDVVGRDPFGPGELMVRSLKRLPTCEAFAIASDKANLIEGAHAQRIAYVYDEAKAIPDPTWDATEGAFAGAGEDTGAEAFALAISTPGEPHGRFYDIHSRKPGYEDWWVRHITLEEAIAAGRISREWAEQRKAQWGEDSAAYQNRVLGEFASSQEDGVIPLAWIELANERWLEWKESSDLPPFECVGVDVAYFGTDKTVLALRFGNTITELRRYEHQDTMATAGRVEGVLKTYGGKAVVDVIGYGAGVVDRLRENKRQVVPFNASERTDAKDRTGELGFTNKRSHAWWNLREILDPASGEEVALPPDPLLTGDLTAPRWRVLSGGKIQVESKEQLAKPERLGRSTDDGDAVVQAFYPEPVPFRVPVAPPSGVVGSSKWRT